MLCNFASYRYPADRFPALLARFIVLIACVVPAVSPALSQEDHWASDRADMVRTIQAYSALLPSTMGHDGISAEVLDVMGKVPRHRFVPKRSESRAYEDTPLPIGFGQTISQPLIVALMTDLLKPTTEATVLEIGTGSGYQAAVVSPLVRKVCTIEIIPELGRTAAQRLEDLDYKNIESKVGDGYFGWPECGPFDGILVTAAAGHVPPPLVKQLRAGGRMVIPVGSVFGPQYLTLVEKTGDGQIKTRQLMPVSFVPLTRATE